MSPWLDYWEVTLTLKPVLYNKDYVEQFAMTNYQVLDMFRHYEWSGVCELTRDLNIHYHLLVKALNSDQTHIDLVRCIKSRYKVFGRYEVKLVTNYDNYTTYIKKDIKIMQESYRINSIIKDDLDIFDSFSIYYKDVAIGSEDRVPLPQHDQNYGDNIGTSADRAPLSSTTGVE